MGALRVIAASGRPAALAASAVLAASLLAACPRPGPLGEGGAAAGTPSGGAGGATGGHGGSGGGAGGGATGGGGAGGSGATGGDGGSAGASGGSTGGSGGAGGEGGSGQAQGQPCAAAEECESGFCVDAVCCDGACSGLCEACVAAKTGGNNGVCSAVAPGTDPDDECAPSAGQCDAGDACSGAKGQCAPGPAPAGYPCRLSQGGCDPGETCDGTSTACPPDTFVAKGLPGLGCGAYLCDGGTACPASCGGDEACTGTHHCATPVCQPWRAVATGGAHTCVRLDAGNVRCWGEGYNGALGYGNKDTLGDDEQPVSAGDVVVGGSVVQIVTGVSHTCALLDSGAVRCWGRGDDGALGLGTTASVGDNETPTSAGDVNVGGVAVALAAGGYHTCALLVGGKVRCWGDAKYGQLGYANTKDIGDDEMPASAGDVDVGGTVVRIAAGNAHTCALRDTGKVRCWGDGAFGQLGYGATATIGDDETPASAGDVDVGGPVVALALGSVHTCALLASGKVRCWGLGQYGRLGYANTFSLGDNETPASAGDVPVGGPVRQITAGNSHTCALLETGKVRCWGWGDDGRLGYASTDAVGDDETPAAVGDVTLGGTAAVVAAGEAHSCALLTTGKLRCWGRGSSGQLGYGNTDIIGDDETPASAGDVPFE